jgi:hypothetical protein
MTDYLLVDGLEKRFTSHGRAAFQDITFSVDQGEFVALMAAMSLPEYVTEFNVASLKANLEIAVRQKLAKPFDLDAMIWKP